MRKTILCVGLGLALGMGCDKGPNNTKPAAPPPPSAPVKASPALPETPAAQPEATTQEMKTNAMAATQSASESANANTAEAQKLLDQTMQYIKENKMDLADKSLTALEKMKPQLPATWGPKIDQARSSFDAAQKGAGLKSLVPGTK